MSGPKPTAPASALKLTLLAKQVRAEAAAILAADPVAIVGLGCRVPGGGDSPEKFWELLCNGVDAVRLVPEGRWDADDWYSADSSAPAKSITKQAGFLEQIDQFDAGYFGVLPREAERMDPQQRLFLEVAIEALDDAGLSRERLRGSRTGVFIASYHNDYTQLQYSDLDAIDARTLTGTLHSVLANRLSYMLDLHGPSVSVDTACSSSLVAIHLACQSLRQGESDIAVAGGVSLIVTPELMVSMSKVGFMSPEGRCRTFDAEANGFGRGEGCGLIVLKRLSDAISDGDRVLAVVRGSAVNQDGHSTLLAAPHGPAQEALIREALANAQLDPGRIGFMEAHGTGTALGDPIEVEAIAATLGRVSGVGPCYLGSAKANLGHLEAAAGVTGLIKAVLSLRHEAIAPQIHFKRLNPHISLESTRLAVPTQLTPWPGGTVPRCAAVSSFGVGGTNAHVIVEEAPRLPEPEEDPAGEGTQILTLSAQSPAALCELISAWPGFLRSSSASLADICFTGVQRRSHYDQRLAVTGRTREEMAERLERYAQGAANAVTRGCRPASGAPRVAFVFSGQGPQWYGMGRELLAAQPVFREALEACDAALSAACGWSVLTELARSEETSRLDQTEIAQPALFAIQVALAALWKSWGIVPTAIVGHSVGEIAALHVAGVLDLATAARVVWQRGRLMQQATGLGQMASVGLTEQEAGALLRGLGDRLSVGAINSPRSIVLSGESAALAEALATLERRGVSHRMLPVKYAFHSAQMAPFERQLAAVLQEVRGSAPTVSFYSTVSGDRADDVSFDGTYFGKNVRSAVRFAPAIAAMVRDGCDVFLEIAPHPVLASAIAECVGELQPSPAIVASLRRGQPERDMLLNACAGLYAAGCDPDWGAVQDLMGRVVSLPAYPWQRKRHWIRKRPVSGVPSERDPLGHPLLGARLDLAFSEQGIFPVDVSAGQAWLAHHRLFDRVLLPAAAVMELFVSAASRVLGTDRPRLEGFALHRPTVLEEEGTGRWQVAARQAEGGHVELSLHQSVPGDGQTGARWRAVASATALMAEDADPTSRSLADAGAGDTLSPDAVYRRFADLGVDFGESFRCLGSIVRAEGYARADIALAAPVAAEFDRYSLHPVLIDAGVQLCSLAASRGPGGELPAQVFLPLGVERMTLRRGSYSRLAAHATVKSSGQGGGLSADISFQAADGTVVGSLQGVAFAPASAAQLAALDVGTSGGRSGLAFDVKWRRVASAGGSSADQGRAAWLIFADRAGTAAAVAQQLTAAGDSCQLVYAGNEFARNSTSVWTLDPENPRHYDRLLTELGASGERREVLHCWSLDVSRYDSAALATEDDRLSCASVLHLTQALARAAATLSAGLCLTTSGAQVVTGNESAATLGPRGAGVWGLAGVIAIEHPELRVRALDLDPALDQAASTGALVRELRDEAFSARVALRGTERWIPELRWHQGAERLVSTTSQPMRLTVANAGTFDGLGSQPIVREALLPGQVRLQVHAAGLNFRDVLLTLGMYPGGGIPLGAECAGVITEIGATVTGLKPGDLVYGYVAGSLGTEATAWAANVAPVPKGTSVEEAAGLAVAYLTAFYGLYRLAGLASGQRVLIHAAAGGVGLAAVELARRRGAEIFATAGSEEKRAYLKRLGVTQVFDSRSLQFADQVLAATDGRGVDVVLNSLAGDFIPAGLRTVARGGCFLELGKRGVWSGEQVAATRPDVRYFVYDLGSEADRDRTLLGPMFAEIGAGLAEGSLRPLPVKGFELGAAGAAMRYMAQARHIGKIVLRVADVSQNTAPAWKVSDKGTYWVTGGFGALGLETARWLVRSGARHLVLTGRHLPGPEAGETLRQLEGQGAHIRCFAVDAADRDAMSLVLKSVRLDGPPLRGVVHAAGVLHDAVLLHQRWEDARAVLGGKAHGAWVLHELTRAEPLDFFILYSAAGQLLGASGQGLYAAANAQLDALAQARSADGLPALSVAWGAWSGGGMAAAAAAAGRDIWTQRGVGKLDAQSGFTTLTRLLEDGAVTGAVMAIDWTRFLAQLPAGADREFYAPVAPSDAAAARPSAAVAIPVSERLRALPAGQRRQALIAHLTTQALAVLGLDPDQPLDPRAPLKDAGLDSLMAVELRNTLNRSAPQPLPATLLFDYPTLEALAGYLAKRWELEPAKPEQVAKVADTLANLSDTEAEALLRAELAELEAERVS